MQISPNQLIDYIARINQRYTALEQKSADEAAQAHADPKAYQRLSKELSDLREVVHLYRTHQRTAQELADAEHMAETAHEPELKELARHEVEQLRAQKENLFQALYRYWEEQHAEPERPLIVEIRAGTGGLEASLFVGDLTRLYQKYAGRHDLSVELMETQPSEAGGFKEAAFAVKGPGAWRRFKYESGVHRVQRVPETEAQGRIHTSTVTVAVLPEPEEVELPEIPAKDLQIDVYRASGPGGQGVNTTDSAVRIRHIPTGLVVTCQDERSQLRNKEKAMRVLRARLLDQMQRSRQEQIASDRRRQVGTGERSEKIRTYNFPDRRVTDHRIGMTLHQLDAVMEGEIDALVDALATDERTRALQQ